MNFEDFYYSIEDSYYDFLESLDEKGLSLYPLTDAIEKQGIPSMPVLGFALLAILIVAGVALFSLLTGQGLFTTTLDYRITVTNNNGAPLQGALVSLTDESDETSSQETGEDGVVLFESVSGEAEVEVSKQGYSTITQIIDADSADVVGNIAEIRFKLNAEKAQAGQSISFLVRDNSGNPAKTSIIIKREGEADEVYTCDEECDVSYYEDATYLNGCGEIISITSTVVEVFCDTESSGSEGSGLLIATVLDEETTQGVESATVSVYNASTGRFIVSGVTDATGKASFNSIPAGQVTLSVTRQGYAPFKDLSVVHSVKPSDTTTALITLNKSNAQFTVTVTGIADAPVQEATIVYHPSQDPGKSQTIKTDLEGKAEFSVTSGEYNLIVSKTGFQTQTLEGKRPGPVNVSLEELGPDAEINNLYLTVKNNSGLPVPGVEVQILQEVQLGVTKSFVESGIASTTNAEGKANLTGFNLEKNYKTRVFFGDQTAESTQPYSFTEPTEDKTEELTLTLTTVTVKASVKLNNTVPQGNVEVFFLEKGKTLENCNCKSPLSNGTAIYNLFKGAPYTVIARLEGYNTKESEELKAFESQETTVNFTTTDQIIDGLSVSIPRPKIVECDNASKTVSVLAASKTYCALFTVTSSGDVETAGFGGLVSDEDQDKIELIGIEAGTVQNAQFDPPIGNWRGATWSPADNYAKKVKLRFKTSPTLSTGDSMNLYYKAWGLTSNDCITSQSSGCGLESSELSSMNAFELNAGNVSNPTECDLETPVKITVLSATRASNNTNPDDFLVNTDVTLGFELCNFTGESISSSQLIAHNGGVNETPSEDILLDPSQPAINIASITANGQTHSINSHSARVSNVSVENGAKMTGQLVMTGVNTGEDSLTIGLYKNAKFMENLSDEYGFKISTLDGTVTITLDKPAPGTSKNAFESFEVIVTPKLNDATSSQFNPSVWAEVPKPGDAQVVNFTREHGTARYKANVTPQAGGSLVIHADDGKHQAAQIAYTINSSGGPDPGNNIGDGVIATGSVVECEIQGDLQALTINASFKNEINDTVIVENVGGAGCSDTGDSFLRVAPGETQSCEYTFAFTNEIPFECRGETGGNCGSSAGNSIELNQDLDEACQSAQGSGGIVTDGGGVSVPIAWQSVKWDYDKITYEKR